MSASRTIPSRSPTITPHIETVCANNTRICPTNSDKRASSPLYPGSMASNSISVSVNLNAAPDTAESNYLPLQNLCRGDTSSHIPSTKLSQSCQSCFFISASFQTQLTADGPTDYAGIGEKDASFAGWLLCVD